MRTKFKNLLIIIGIYCTLYILNKQMNFQKQFDYIGYQSLDDTNILIQFMKSAINIIFLLPLNFIDNLLKGIHQSSQILDIETLKSKLQNKCLNIQGISDSYENLSKSQQLQAFINGPCSPTIIIPGLMASALVAEINCKELQQYEPEIFSNCGWNTCEDNIWSFDSKPKPEYHLWMPSLFDDLSPITHDKCFGSIIQLRYNSTATNFREKYVSPRGIKVSWRGNTPETKENGECGKQGIINLADDHQTVNFLTQKLLGFKNTIELIEAMGYQSGITYQALPYDFRKAMVYNDITPYIQQSLESLYKFTGKKTVILSHSYGSLRTLKALTSFDQKFKDQYISHWIGNGSPFSGVNRLIKTHINSDDEFVEKLNLFDNEFYVGIQFQNQNLNANGASCLFDLYPKDPMSTYKNETWMLQIQDRIRYEQQINQYKPKNEKPPLNFFPPKNEQCTNLVNEHDGHCQTGMYDQDSKHLIHINGQEFNYSFEDIKKMLQQFSTIDNIDKIYEESYQKYLYNMTNPGVPFVNIYGGFNEIETQYEYSLNPNEYTEKGEFYFPNITMKSKGDLTVSTNSVLIAPLKWQWEYEQFSEVDNKFKPVRFVELCSTNRLTNNVNIDQNEQGEYTFNETGYNGLQCKCQFTKNGNDCDHASFLNDPYVVQFFVNQLKNQQKTQYTQNHEFTDEYLTEFVQKCDNLKLKQ